ncbi:MAG: ThiF family adenylyltransferase, partial [Nitrospinaceae bacterium]|nr:ThiF family adenylyltransferase [Nitrospinaceae bacterium]
MALTQDQINRYSRHLLLPEVGVEGQEKICNSKVLLIGTGGLGSPLALYLAAAGVGNLGLVDFDVVDFSNLQRQVAHGESTVGKLKVDSAKARIADLNSSINVTTYN